jgi:phytoene dehydrogenase-like protein
MSKVTIVGGGLAGLVASITAAEGGAQVELLEAHRRLGGRARSSDGPYIANFGPHALYKRRANWTWLAERGLLPRTVKPPASGARYRYRGRVRRLPPVALARARRLARTDAPVDADFRSWAADAAGGEVAELLCRIAGVITFDHDPGRLSAAFVWERLRWVYAPPSVRYVAGGWSTLVDALEADARQIGVEIHTGARADTLPEPPVIVATALADARRLLADDTLRWEGGRAVLVDLGLRRRRGDPAAVFDLDDGTFAVRYSAGDRSLAPPGRELVQAQVGLGPGESVDDGGERIERTLDATFNGWRERVEWRRRQLADARSGALDLPGTTWRNRPAIDRGDGVFLAGDTTAAPGILSEVAFASAAEAARLALASAAARRGRRREQLR